MAGICSKGLSVHQSECLFLCPVMLQPSNVSHHSPAPALALQEEDELHSIMLAKEYSQKGVSFP
jgi:hypothetical protein